MRWRNPLLDEYVRLQAEANDQRRGFDFQALIGRVFEQNLFDIVENPGAAAPRRTDLFATKDRDNYLIETKWRRRKVADIGDIDSLFSRLERTESSVVGVFFSHSGFSSRAMNRVLTRRERPILLFERTEIERLIEGNLDLSACLRQKHQELRVHGRVLLDEVERAARSSRRRGSGLPLSNTAIVLPDGRRTAWISGRGDFSQFVFAEELPDIDWVPAAGHGVVVDLSLPEMNQMGLVEALEKLGTVGWAGESGRWSIQQSTRNWHGIGPRTLAQAIINWESRYEEVETIHHTEQLCYQDVAEGGFYTLTADISASEGRRVWHCDLSLQLVGIPMDIAPLRQLAESLKAIEPWYFRPLDQKSVKGGHFSLGADKDLDLVALVVERDEDEENARDRDWVNGIVVQNPFDQMKSREEDDRHDEWLPLVSESELLMCSLRSHHPLSEPPDKYFLRRYEWSWTSEALVFRPIADWA